MVRFGMSRPDPALLIYLRNHIEDNGYAPSVREMAAYLGKSLDTTQKRLRALSDAGLIERVGPRAIRIKDA